MTDWATLNDEGIILVADDEDESSVVQKEGSPSEGKGEQQAIEINRCICIDCIFGGDCSCEGECDGNCSGEEE